MVLDTVMVRVRVCVTDRVLLTVMDRVRETEVDRVRVTDTVRDPERVLPIVGAGDWVTLRVCERETVGDLELLRAMFDRERVKETVGEREWLRASGDLVLDMDTVGDLELLGLAR